MNQTKIQLLARAITVSNLTTYKFPAKAIDTYRCSLRDHELEDPVRCRAGRSAFGAHCKRLDFGRIEQRNSLPSYAEEHSGEEEECYRHFHGFLLGVRNLPPRYSVSR
jgi:hypothetical protein